MLRRLFPQFSARRAYFAADAFAERALADLADPVGDATSRARALRTAADCESVMADAAYAFGGAADRDDDGFTLTESHRGAAMLLGLVASSEEAANRRVEGWADTARDDDLGEVRQLRRTCDPADRARLTLALYDAVVARVGGQAAEALVAVARGYFMASGMSWPEANRSIVRQGRGVATEGGAR